MLRFTGEKMAKSAGNVATIREVLDEWGREAILVFFLSGHWRKPIDYSDETMTQARVQWQSFVQAIYENRPPQPATGWNSFEDALNDDFNTSEALAVMHEWRAASQLDLLNRGLSVFGLGFVLEDPPDEVQALAKERIRARELKDFEESDRLRDEIHRLGWVVQDGPEGTTLVPRKDV
jgi:cysteinyl-tRNA synthetase